ncbi:MAG: glycoside hydrolase family 38 C-terminal domain-containing protein [Candidatus Kapaibacterium sp.]
MKESRGTIIHMIGNAHLDPAWMWSWGEGMEAFIATCRSALDRMEETPEFIFTCSSAAHYRWVEEVEPELFDAIRRRVLEGRWAIVGGWWTQADCNLPSGEGFARQALLGQRYFLEKFGRAALTGYSPDAFGHDAGLPQLLARAGMTGYIFCRPDPTELALPSPLFRWIGADGSGVLGYRVPFHYNMYETSVPKKVADLEDALEKGSALAADGGTLSRFGSEWMLFYGVGNHGGGPTREQIAQIISIDIDPSAPALLFSNPDRFFRAVESRSADWTVPEWRGDLQLNAPGCYSAHSEIKRLNRLAEHSLLAAERLSALASILTGFPYPAADLKRAWEDVCFNHFHDILCGVAIREALDDAIGMYGEALTIARKSSRHALQRLARSIDTGGDGRTLIVFNPHAMEIAAHVTFELWHDIDKKLWPLPVVIRVTDDEGNDLPVQPGFTSGKIGKDRIAVMFPVSIPALGWRCYRVFHGEHSRAETENACDVIPPDRNGGTAVLENDLLRVEISAASGAITRIFHKPDSRELLSGPAAEPVAINDPTDTWGHGVERFDDIIGTFGGAEVRLVENGPTHATVRVVSRWRGSWMQQDFRLHRDSVKIHAAVKIFWGETGTMLKLRFAAAVAEPMASCESAYTITTKPCNGIERPKGSWCAIHERSGASGIGIIDNAKHGFSADGSILSITLLRSPSYATHDPHPFHPNEDLDVLDQGIQRFSYIISPILSPGWREGLSRDAAMLNAPLFVQFESAHKGAEGTPKRTFGGVIVEPGNVMMTVLKRSEDDCGWIARLYESGGVESAASLSIPMLRATWRGTLAAHEVRTLLITDGGDVTDTDLIETTMPATVQG